MTKRRKKKVPSKIGNFLKKNKKVEKTESSGKIFKVDLYSICIMVLTIVATLSVIALCWCYTNYKKNMNNAEFVLKKTMEFKGIEEIKKHMDEVEPYLTPELYKQYGLNDEDFTYYNFYKMRNEVTSIEVVDKKGSIFGGVITYKIDNKYINKSRRFIMIYEVKKGRFVKIEFYELAGRM